VTILHLLLAVHCLINLLCTAFTDPGILPRAFVDNEPTVSASERSNDSSPSGIYVVDDDELQSEEEAVVDSYLPTDHAHQLANKESIVVVSPPQSINLVTKRESNPSISRSAATVAVPVAEADDKPKHLYSHHGHQHEIPERKPIGMQHCSSTATTLIIS
jgi:hypothetical protein